MEGKLGLDAVARAFKGNFERDQAGKAMLVLVR
jgi:hypothetical protein